MHSVRRLHSATLRSKPSRLMSMTHVPETGAENPYQTRSSAVADRPLDASLHILLSHSRSFEMTILSRACSSLISIPLKLCLYLVPFLRHSASKNSVTLKKGVGSFKVIENGAVRQTIYEFLLVRHYKYTALSSTVFELVDVE